MFRSLLRVALTTLCAAATAFSMVLLLAQLEAKAAALDVCSSGCTYSSIQAAINAASDNDLIRVAAGNYTESLQIGKSLTLRGGYAGPPSWTRNLLSYTTKVVGDNLQSAIAITGAGMPISVTLDGLTIQKGRGTPIGGGVRAKQVNLSLQDSLIANNTLTATNDLTTALGAGVYLESGALWASGNTFRNNDNNCTGLYCSTNDGGGLFLTGTLAATLLNNLFDANYSWRGAALATFNTPLYAAGNTLQNNIGTYGSGAYAEGSGVPVLEHNQFLGNNTGDRGALFLYNVDGLILSSNIFSGNYGYYGSTLVYYNSRPVTLTNNLLVNNSGSRYARGLIVNGADGVFVNNTFANFTSPSQTVPFLYLVGGSYTLANNIFFSLTTGISLPASMDTAWLSHNAFDGNAVDWAGAGIVPGAGNLTSTNPLFVSAPRDYHLRPDSPLLDMGDSAFNPGVDFEGDPRFDPPDIGADEYVLRVWLPLVRKN